MAFVKTYESFQDESKPKYVTHINSQKIYDVIHINSNGDYVIKAVGGDVYIYPPRQIDMFFEKAY
jgi:hypothetical protein